MAKANKPNKAEEQQDKLINLQAQQLAAQVANWAAQLEFQKERLRLLELPEMQGKLQVDVDRLAFDKAQATWENAFKEATLTGTYNGQPTTEWLTQQAQLTGVLNGSQTLQGKLTDAQIAQMNNSMKLANDEFIANTTGYLNGRPTFDREKFMAGQAQDAWKFLATLTGPSNAFKQARAISSMPGGMGDLMSMWAGTYGTPGSTAVGSGGQATLGGLMLGAAGDYSYPAQAPTQGISNWMQPAPMPGQPGGPPIASTTQPVYGGSPYQPPAAAPISAPPPTGAQTPGGNPNEPAIPTGVIPGRGFPPQSWNAATRAAAEAWQAAHPGWLLDGSATGFHQIPITPPTTYTPTETVPGTPTSYNEGEVTPPTAGQPGEATGGGSASGYIGDPVPSIGYADAGPSQVTTDTSYSAWNAPAYNYSPAGVQAQPEQWNYSPTMSGTMQVYPPGTYSPYDSPDISTPFPISPSVARNLYHYGGGANPNYDAAGAGPAQTGPASAGNAPGTVGQGYSGMLLPSQINAKNYANSYQYQKDLGWAAYEDAGWDKSLAQESFQRSLPKTGGPKSGSFAY